MSSNPMRRCNSYNLPIRHKSMKSLKLKFEDCLEKLKKIGCEGKPKSFVDFKVIGCSLDYNLHSKLIDVANYLSIEASA